jgi:hypothetical protein
LQVLFRLLVVLALFQLVAVMEELQVLELVTLVEKAEMQIVDMEEAILEVAVALVVTVELAVLAKQMELMQLQHQELVALAEVVDGLLVMVDMVAVV